MRKLLVRLLQITVAAIVILVGIVILVSPQTTDPFLNEAGQLLEDSIAEIRTIELNGTKQRILIRGQNVNNPILLHVHGGPGGADQAIVRSSGNTIEDIFTVVYWDQRGAGASYNPSMGAEALSLSNIVDDGILLTRLLQEEFGGDKIYLEGHSWGTLVGIHMVAKSPSLYDAYFGIGQVANSKQAELLSYNYTLAKAEEAGDKRTIDQLEKIGKPPYDNDQRWIDTVMIERGLMQPYEIPGQQPFFSMTDIYKSFVFYPEYSVRDKLNSLEGSKVSMQALWMEAINANLFESHPKLAIPVYIFQGKYDKHTVTEVAKNYYEMLQAPHKEYFSFDNSAHWPHLKQHEQYRQILQRILTEN